MFLSYIEFQVENLINSEPVKIPVGYSINQPQLLNKSDSYAVMITDEKFLNFLPAQRNLLADFLNYKLVYLKKNI